MKKELVIAFQRLGQKVIAVDSYENAPAMHVSNDHEVIDMLDGNMLDKIVDKHNPDIIVPEVESIRTERFYEYEKKGIKIVPSAKAANFTMNRKAIRDLAAKDLKELKQQNTVMLQHIKEFQMELKSVEYPV